MFYNERLVENLSAENIDERAAIIVVTYKIGNVEMLNQKSIVKKWPKEYYVFLSVPGVPNAIC